MTQRDLVIGAAAGLTVAFIWSGWLVLNRLAAAQALTPWDIIAMRFTIATLALSPWLLRRAPLRRLGWRRAGALAILGPAAPFSALTIYGLEFAPAAHAAVVSNGLLPAITTALAFAIAGAAPSRLRLLGVGLITLGVAAMGGVDLLTDARDGAWRGHVLFAIAAALLAGYITLSARWGVAGLDAAASVAALNCAAVLPFWLLGALPSGFAQAPLNEILLQGLYQGLGPGVVGIVLMTISITRLGAPNAGALAALVPGVTALAAWLFLDETLTALEGVGVAITILGIGLSALGGPGRRSPPTG